MILALALTFGAAAATPQASVEANVVTSSSVTITLPSSARYLGRDTFTLTDPKLGPFDDCTLFAFVEATRTQEVQKLYWVQFEEYKPSHPELHHIYNSPRRVEIAGLDFYVDTWTSTGKDAERGSDAEHFNALLTAKGYARTPMTVVRLVHLFDNAKRRELMIIYGETNPSDAETVLRHAIAQVRIGQRHGG